MPKIRWNGGLEVDIKSVVSMAAFIFACGGIWVKIDSSFAAVHMEITNLEKKVDEHLAATQDRIREHDKMMEVVKALALRVDACCPYQQKGAFNGIGTTGRKATQ